MSNTYGRHTWTYGSEGWRLEVDAIVELRDGRRSAFEVKTGADHSIEQAARSLRGDVAESRAGELCSLNVITAGATSYTRPDGVNVVALGHLSA